MRLWLAPAILVFSLQAANIPRLNQVTRLFDRMWTEYFAARGESYRPPALVAFTGKRESPCGKINPGNAYYCEKDNTVYFDEDFLAALRLRVAAETGTTGDSAPVIAIAHELGHAVFAQMNHNAPPHSPIQQLHGYGEEKVADCLSGALTRAAAEQRILSPSVLPEAEATMAIIGKLQPRNGHPTWRVRHDSFLSGYRNGVQACSAISIEKLTNR